jgi:hypothetical protein
MYLRVPLRHITHKQPRLDAVSLARAQLVGRAVRVLVAAAGTVSLSLLPIWWVTVTMYTLHALVWWSFCVESKRVGDYDRACMARSLCFDRLHPFARACTACIVEVARATHLVAHVLHNPPHTHANSFVLGPAVIKHTPLSSSDLTDVQPDDSPKGLSDARILKKLNSL